jgi:hypothetical protein
LTKVVAPPIKEETRRLVEQTVGVALDMQKSRAVKRRRSCTYCSQIHHQKQDPYL